MLKHIGTTQSTARAFVGLAGQDQRGPARKNVQNRARRRGAVDMAAKQVVKRGGLKGPYLGK